MTSVTHHGDGSEELAPVTYLPGIFPAEAAPHVQADSAEGADDATEVGGGSPSKKTVRRASNVSMAALTRRNLSRWELERLLRSRELDEQVIADEMARLEGAGLIDDAELARTLVRVHHERKGQGRQAIVAELRRRHIDQQWIDAALDDLSDDEQSQRAHELAQKRAQQMTSLDYTTASRRLSAYLQRKGYGSSVIREAVDSALGRGGRGGDTGGVRFR